MNDPEGGGSAEFSSLLTPLLVSRHRIRNRIGLGPINNALFTDTGDASSKCLAFFSQFAESGLGLIYIGGVAVTSEGRSNKGALLLDKVDRSYGLTKVIEAIHARGGSVAIQLMHAGRQTRSAEIGQEIIAASAIPCPIVLETPRAATHEDIARVVTAFATSAEIAEHCGVDLIEIHAAHGYLISGFLSPYSNTRNDEYGGSVYNRFRLLREILSAVRQRVRIPIGVRINCVENAVGGMILRDVERGILSIPFTDIDFLALSAGVYSTKDIIMPPRQMGSGLWQVESAILKRRLSIPIFLTGNIDSVRLADEIVSTQAADLVLMVRSLLADPRLVPKALDIHAGKVQECTDCKGCKYHSRGKESVYCPYNEVLSGIRRRTVVVPPWKRTEAHAARQKAEVMHKR